MNQSILSSQPNRDVNCQFKANMLRVTIICASANFGGRLISIDSGVTEYLHCMTNVLVLNSIPTD